MQGRSRTRKIVYFRVNFKLFAEGSKTWRIWSNDKKGTRCIILRRFYWLMAKYLKSDSITESYVVTKIPLRQPISNLSKRAVVPRSFSQKDNGIWSPDHYPCLALGLVFQNQENQEKHFWGLVFPPAGARWTLVTFHGQSAHSLIYAYLWLLPFTFKINIWRRVYFEN